MLEADVYLFLKMRPMKYDTFKDMTSIKFNKAAEMNFDCCSIASLNTLQNSSFRLAIQIILVILIAFGTIWFGKIWFGIPKKKKNNNKKKIKKKKNIFFFWPILWLSKFQIWKVTKCKFNLRITQSCWIVADCLPRVLIRSQQLRLFVTIWIIIISNCEDAI